MSWQHSTLGALARLIPLIPLFPIALLNPAAYADGARVLVIDPGDTLTGVRVEQILSNLPILEQVRRVDVSGLTNAAGADWDAVVWLDPEPSLYKPDASAAWKKLLASGAGVMVIGLPRDSAGRRALIDALQDRGGPRVGISLDQHLQGCNWIWTEKTSDNSAVFLRRRFELTDAPPPRAFVQALADNRSRIWVNGTLVGETTDWRRPKGFDVARLLRRGENVVAVEGYNEDGPAGLVLSLIGRDEHGDVTLHLKTGPDWKASPAAPEKWTELAFDDSTWAAARIIAKPGGGYWEDKPGRDYGANEFELQIAPIAHPATANVSGAIGRVVLLDALEPSPACATILRFGQISAAVAGERAGRRMILFAGYPELTADTSDDASLRQRNGFANWLLRSLAWLAQQDSDVQIENWSIPESMVGGQTLTLRGRSTDAPGKFRTITALVRDGPRVLLSEQRELSGDGAFEFGVPIPTVGTTGRLDVVVRAGEGTKRQAVRIGSVRVLDPVPLRVGTRDGRWVFGAAESVHVEAWLDAADPPLGNLDATLRGPRGEMSLGDETRLNGRATWTIRPGEIGAYDVTARFVAAEDGTARGEQRFHFEIVSRARPDQRLGLTMQLTPPPHEGLTTPRMLPQSGDALRRVVDNLIAHGTTNLQCPLPVDGPLARDIESYAQSRGLAITYYFERPCELFGRNKPPPVPIHSAEYSSAVRKRLDGMLPHLTGYPRLLNTFILQDEPFHAGQSSFDHRESERVEFRKRYGYELPETLDNTDKSRLDALNFHSDSFGDGWRQVYPMLKASRADVQFWMNHDSHNTFGGAVDQEGKLFVDEVFHWGSDWADGYSLDIYPYLMTDFRYGLNRKLKLPRIAQTHYALAHMQHLCRAGNKPLGFWVGTYNPEWYSLKPECREQYWMEREMACTAVAAGADELFGGIGIPIDQKHWDDFGEAMRVLHRAGPALVASKPVRAKAAMLFPRTQCLLLQEEYWNVGESFEEYRRAFGELDLIHEEQVAAGELSKYRMLVLFDVKLLPRSVAEKISAFARSGGTVLADCMPQLDERHEPLDSLKTLFGVKQSTTGRIHWPIRRDEEGWVKIDEAGCGQIIRDHPPIEVRGTDPCGGEIHFNVVSPRAAKIAGATVLAGTSEGEPALLRHAIGKSKAYLLGFCLQDTAFELYRTGNGAALAQLRATLRACAGDANVTPSVFSSNPEVEASLRIGERAAFLFVIAHEPVERGSTVSLRNLSGKIERVVDIEREHEVPIEQRGGGSDFHVDAPTGTTRLYRIEFAR
jgi:hypothetical protein